VKDKCPQTMTISAKDLLRYLDGMTFPVDVLAPKDDRVMVWATGDQLLGLMAANGVDGIGSKGRVNRSARVLANGLPVVPDYREMGPATGQQKGCMVLSDKERAKGFVRPVRQVYHTRTRVWHGHQDGPGNRRDVRP